MRGRSLVRDVMEELHPDPVRMEDAAVAAPGAGACVMSAIPQLPPEPRSSAAASLDRRIQMLRTAMGPHRRRRGTDYLVGRGH
ncbi:hypothetical protein CBF45_10610 [Bordetella sp. J329]|nr:hypothetical protein CBF45_10610 [Bordetella sp. J329]